MPTTRLRWFSRSSLLLALVASPSQAASCDMTVPADVFTCLVAAYAGRDADAVAALYASDFEYVMGKHRWGREKELASTRAMFSEPTVEEISLQVDDGFVVAAGAAPNTWVVSGVALHLAIRQHRDDKTDSFRIDNTGHTVFLREVEGQSPRYVIYRWEAPEPD